MPAIELITPDFEPEKESYPARPRTRIRGHSLGTAVALLALLVLALVVVGAAPVPVVVPGAAFGVALLVTIAQASLLAKSLGQPTGVCLFVWVTQLAAGVTISLFGLWILQSTPMGQLPPPLLAIVGLPAVLWVSACQTSIFASLLLRNRPEDSPHRIAGARFAWAMEYAPHVLFGLLQGIMWGAIVGLALILGMQ